MGLEFLSPALVVLGGGYLLRLPLGLLAVGLWLVGLQPEGSPLVPLWPPEESLGLLVGLDFGFGFGFGFGLVFDCVFVRSVVFCAAG